MCTRRSRVRTKMANRIGSSPSNVSDYRDIRLPKATATRRTRFAYTAAMKSSAMMPMPPRSRSSRFAGGGLTTSKTLKMHEAGSRPRPAHGDHEERHEHAHDLVDDDRSPDPCRENGVRLRRRSRRRPRRSGQSRRHAPPRTVAARPTTKGRRPNQMCLAQKGRSRDRNRWRMRARREPTHTSILTMRAATYSRELF